MNYQDILRTPVTTTRAQIEINREKVGDEIKAKGYYVHPNDSQFNRNEEEKRQKKEIKKQQIDFDLFY